MSGIIEGYNYDIFISYRQKDNKGDKWVSTFVEGRHPQRIIFTSPKKQAKNKIPPLHVPFAQFSWYRKLGQLKAILHPVITRLPMTMWSLNPLGIIEMRDLPLQVNLPCSYRQLI